MKTTKIISCIVGESLPVVLQMQRNKAAESTQTHTQNSQSSLRLVKNLKDKIVSDFYKHCSCCNNKWKTTFYTSVYLRVLEATQNSTTLRLAEVKHSVLTTATTVCEPNTH